RRGPRPGRAGARTTRARAPKPSGDSKPSGGTGAPPPVRDAPSYPTDTKPRLLPLAPQMKGGYVATRKRRLTIWYMPELLHMIHPNLLHGGSAETIGARLKRLRLQSGFSQRDLSSPGVSYAYISRIEAGARTPSVKALRKLSQKLGVSVEYLETGRDIRDVADRELRLADAELELRLARNTAEAEKKLTEVFDEAAQAGDVVSATRAQLALGLVSAQRGNHLDAVERLEAVLEGGGVSVDSRPDVYATL